MPVAVHPHPAPRLPRWAGAAFVALGALVGFQWWLIHDWRALALSRANADVAARGMCASTLAMAQQQATLLDEFSAEAERALAELAACKVMGVLREDAEAGQ